MKWLRIQIRVSEKLPCIAMKLIGTRLGDNVDVCAGGQLNAPESIPADTFISLIASGGGIMPRRLKSGVTLIAPSRVESLSGA